MTRRTHLTHRRTYLRGPAIERFYAQVDLSGGPFACHPWLGARTTEGYGCLYGDDGRMVNAHRFALSLFMGRPLAPGMYACHNCPGGDDRGCVNPLHLFEGTPGDNNRDTLAKGRHRSGPGRYGPRNSTTGRFEAIA